MIKMESRERTIDGITVRRGSNFYEFVVPRQKIDNLKKIEFNKGQLLFEKPRHVVYFLIGHPVICDPKAKVYIG